MFVPVDATLFLPSLRLLDLLGVGDGGLPADLRLLVLGTMDSLEVGGSTSTDIR